jgi:glycosyltransferase involved in cell wall biosynthesis
MEIPAKVLFVGRLDTPKDPITLLAAAKEIIFDKPDTHFTLVGDGEKYNDCELFIRKNDLSDNIILPGWQSDVSRYYKTHDIFLASSIYEAFGLMFLEAGYYKLPVVATNVEGIPEVVEDNVTGLLCPPKQPHLLAANVLKLIKDKDLRTAMGQRGYERVTNLFSIEAMVNKYKYLYEKI